MYNTQMGVDVDWGQVLTKGLTSELAKDPSIQMEVKKAGYSAGLDTFASWLAKNQTLLMTVGGVAIVGFVAYQLMKK